jgi:hypothetical protein
MLDAGLLWGGGRVDVSPTDGSPTESSWMLRTLDIVSQMRYVPTLDRVMHRRHNAWTAQRMGVVSAKSG